MLLNFGDLTRTDVSNTTRPLCSLMFITLFILKLKIGIFEQHAPQVYTEDILHYTGDILKYRSNSKTDLRNNKSVGAVGGRSAARGRLGGGNGS